MLRSLHSRLYTGSLWSYRSTRLAKLKTIKAFTRSYSDNVPPITPVEEIVLKHVKAIGPMSYATYMQFCLAHPTEGYYMKASNRVFGPKGDFVTSPEISQIFGELIGVWLLSQWEAAGSPPGMRLIELGPGRGTLTEDILRTINTLTRRRSVQPTIQVDLVETSLMMREVQQKRLVGSNVEPRWHDSIDNVQPSADAFTMLVAHEFFDALPINVLRKTEEGWKEIMVSSTTSNSNSDYPRLQHVLSPERTAISTTFGNSSLRFQALPAGSDLEVSPNGFRIARKIGELLTQKETESGSRSLGGCGLVIDYGGAKAYGSSRRAFKEHQVVDIFHRPGECDLTANVDFAYLKEAMQDLVSVHGPVSQRSFLSNMGIAPRLHALLKHNYADEAKMERILQSATRLVDPLKMGNEYSVMGISANGSDCYPFNEPEEDSELEEETSSSTQNT